MKIEKHIKLDFSVKSALKTVFAKQSDDKSRYVYIQPLMNGVPWVLPEGVSVLFCVDKPDGHSVMIDGATSASGYPKVDNGEIVVELTAQTLAAHGMATASISLVKDGAVLSTQNFLIDIEEQPAQDNLESSDEYQAFTGALNQIAQAKEDAEEAVEKANSAIEKLEDAGNDYANAIKGEAEGNVAVLKNVSPVPHMISVRLTSDNLLPSESVTVQSCGKNFLPYPYASAFGERYGCTVTDGGNGTVVINGQPTATFDFTLSNNLPVLPNVKYTFSGNANKTGGHLSIIQLRTEGGSWVRNLGDDNGQGYTFTVTEDDLANGNRVWANLFVQTGHSYDNVIFKPMLEIGSAATDYEPYIGESVNTNIGAEDIRLSSISPTMNIFTDRYGVNVYAKYNIDTNSVIGKFSPVIIDKFGCLDLEEDGKINIEIPHGAKFCFIAARAKKEGVCDIIINVTKIAEIDVKIIAAGFSTAYYLAFPLAEMPNGSFIPGRALIRTEYGDEYISVSDDIAGIIAPGNTLTITNMDFGADEHGDITVSFY